MSAPCVAVIVPAFNAERFLTQTIQSVLAQTIPDWEMVIVDDGSMDGTARIAQQFADADPRIHVVRQSNGGVSRARNRGLEEMNPAVQAVAFLDADDTWEPNTLHILWNTLQSNPNAAGAYGITRLMDEEGHFLPGSEHGDYDSINRRAIVDGKFTSWLAEAPTTFAVLLCQNCIPASGVLLRHEAVAKVGGFDPSVSPSEDWDYWLRISAYADFVFVEAVVHNYRQHGSNASGQGRMFAAQRRVRHKAVLSPAFTAEQKKTALQAYRLAEREHARYFLDLSTQSMRRGKLIGAVKLLRQAAISLYTSILSPAKV